MGKGKRLRHRKKAGKKDFTKAFSDKLTENFQKELRNSEIWDQMVAEFGEEKAEQILRECKADVKPGISEQ
jgi:uncharacterized protein YaaW (UPF0174 family)